MPEHFHRRSGTMLATLTPAPQARTSPFRHGSQGLRDGLRPAPPWDDDAERYGSLIQPPSPDDERVLLRYASVMTGYVYMTASQKRGTIYIGVTNSLARRLPEHKSGEGSHFTSRYAVTRLVWYEDHFDMRDAIQREKSLKRFAPPAHRPPPPPRHARA